MNIEPVILKGSNEGIIILLDEDKDFEEIKQNLIDKFMTAQGFFDGSKIDIRVRGRELDTDEKQDVTDIIYNIIGNEVNITFEKEIRKTDKIEINNINPNTTKFYRGTVRSGQLIKSDGDLIIIGDVNPGAQLIAEENIVVMGSLRGIVHAGYSGNTDAIIAAINLYATQLRIANVISRRPDEYMPSKEIRPEIAYIKDNMIYIDSYLSKNI